MDRPLPWLKYVDANDLDDGSVDFVSMDVESPTGEHLGEVDGFIVDGTGGRPYYIVVNSGGWFKSKNYLLPVGHAALDSDRQAFVSSLERTQVDRFPGFDKDEFEKLPEADIKRFNNETCIAIAGEQLTYPSAEPLSAAWDRSAYRYPDWWQASTSSTPLPVGEPSLADLTRPVDRTSTPVSSSKRAAAKRDVADPDTRAAASREVEPSPHYDGRAQPGDVIGIETGGETTQIGDTADTENDRRRDAERTS